MRSGLIWFGEWSGGVGGQRWHGGPVFSQMQNKHVNMNTSSGKWRGEFQKTAVPFSSFSFTFVPTLNISWKYELLASSSTYFHPIVKLLPVIQPLIPAIGFFYFLDRRQISDLLLKASEFRPTHFPGWSIQLLYIESSRISMELLLL